MHNQQLYELLASSIDITIVFVCGHGLEETIPVLTNPFIPRAQFITNQLGCDIIYSGQKCIDVLPKMVKKGRTLVKLVDHLQVKSGDVMVAAGNVNNLSLFNAVIKA